MTSLRRYDQWQPSATWWVLGGVLIVFVTADLLAFGDYNREIAILGVIGFIGMVLEIVVKKRAAALARQVQNG